MEKIEIPKTVQELVERYTTDLEQKVEKFAILKGDWAAQTLKRGMSQNCVQAVIESEFDLEYFREALTAFAEAVAQKQREICNQNVYVFDSSEHDPESILLAPSPIKP